jgi:hypothetical protein
MYLRSAALEEGDYGQDTTVVALKTLAQRSAVPVALELNLGSRLDEHLEPLRACFAALQRGI